MKKYKKNNTSGKNSSQYDSNSRSGDKTNESNKENTETNSNITEEERQQLIKQISITELSIFAISLIIYASILNIRYLEWQRIKIIDQLNTTNYAETMQNLTEVPRRANIIFLFVTSIFTGVLIDNYKTAVSQTGENRNQEEIENTYKNVIAILLILLGTTINFEVLNC